MSELHPKLKEVFPKAIEAYEDAIRNMPLVRWKEYLFKLKVGEGICAWAVCTLGVEILYEMADIKRGRWFDVPGLSTLRSEAIHRLQLRVDRMKELLKESKT